MTYRTTAASADRGGTVAPRSGVLHRRSRRCRQGKPLKVSEPERPRKADFGEQGQEGKSPAVTLATPRCGVPLKGDGTPRAFPEGDLRVVRMAEQTVEVDRLPSGSRGTARTERSGPGRVAVPGSRSAPIRRGRTAAGEVDAAVLKR